MNLFTENLERLFETVRKPDGKKYTEVEIEASSLQSGLNITKAYIQRLRRGESTNPSYDKIVALAKHFNVHPGYFFEKHKDEEIQERSISQLSNSIALRARGAESKEDIKELLVDMATAIESIHSGIDSIPDETPRDRDEKRKNR